MGKYLTAVRDRNFCTTSPEVLQELQEDPSCTSCGTQQGTLEKYWASEQSTRPPDAHRHWWIHFADREPLEVIFTPEPTHAKVLALYPAAVAAEPLPDVLAEPLTPEPAPLVPDDRRPGHERWPDLLHNAVRDESAPG